MLDKCETTVLGNGEWDFMKRLPNDSGENGVSIAIYGVSELEAVFALQVVCLPRNAMHERGYLYGGCVKKA